MSVYSSFSPERSLISLRNRAGVKTSSHPPITESPANVSNHNLPLPTSMLITDIIVFITFPPIISFSTP